MLNDVVLAHLFIGTLRSHFDWFLKLSEGSIHSWIKLEKLFLSRLFKDDSEVALPTLLGTKQESEEPIKSFVERF